MLSVNQQLIDLGEMSYGSSYSFNFLVKNEYPFKVKINKVYVGCTSCTTASGDKNELNPGETLTVKTKFTPGSTGIQNKQIMIAYSDMNNKVFPDLILKFKGVVNGQY